MHGPPAGTYAAAAAFHAAAVDPRRSSAGFRTPSEAHAALKELLDSQLHLMHALDGLGRWHQGARAGAEFADDKQSSDGVLEAAFELRTAVDQCGELYQTLIRAHHAGSQVRWCGPDQD